MVTFTGRQARLERDARQNELTAIEQRSFLYPRQADQASNYLRRQGESGRDAYYGVHLFREPGSRLSSNSIPTVSCLWLDEDEGYFPETSPTPSAEVHSSNERRHLYWRLTRRVSTEWATAMNRRIATWSGGDVGKAGLASVLRPPGTSNYKRHPVVDEVRGQMTGEAWSPEVMEQAIPPLPEPETKPNHGNTYDGPPIELADYLSAVEVLYETPDGLSNTKYAIVCPWIDEHSCGDRSGTYIGQRIGGGPWFHCNHEHCQGRTWRGFKRKAGRRGTVIRVTLPGYTGAPLEVSIDG